ncbi:MAG: hypothetical protein ACTSW4_03245 [Candidatus Ranarchaeia archaeon]
MHYLTKLIHGEIDEEVHRAFTGYSQGKFPGPIIEINITKKNIKAKSGPYYGKLLTEFTAVHFPPDKEVEVSGVIESPIDFRRCFIENHLEGSISKKKGIFKWKGTGVIKGRDLKAICETVIHDSWTFLDITPLDNALSWKVKTKKKISKSQLQKPPDTKFASAVFDLNQNVKESLKEWLYPDFDLPSFSKLRIENYYEIIGLVIPDDPEMDPRTKRLQTKRKGILHRKAIMTKNRQTTEISETKHMFEA